MKTNGKTILEFTDLVRFNRFLEIDPPLEADFDAGRLEELDLSKLAKDVPSFRHCFFSICLATRLDMRLNLGYYNRRPKPPFLLFKTPYQLMSWQLHSGIKEGWHAVFTERFMQTYSPLNQIVQELAFLQIDKAIPLEIETSETEELNLIFEHIASEVASRHADRYEIIVSYMVALLIKIRRIYKRLSAQDDALNKLVKKSDNSVFGRFNAMLKEPAYGDVKNVKYFADRLNVHSGYLNAVVKRITGMSALSFIHNHLLNEAKTLLLQTDLSVKEIAFRLSFKEHTHFSAFFKKRASQSPTQFRKGESRKLGG